MPDDSASANAVFEVHGSFVQSVHQLGDNMTSKLLTAVLAAMLAVSVSAFSYAADTSEASHANRSAALSDAEASAMKECRKLTATEQARCIVNVRPTSAG